MNSTEHRALVEIVRERSRPREPEPALAGPSLPQSAAPVRAVLFDIYGTLIGSGAGDIGTDGNCEVPPTGVLADAGLSPRSARQENVLRQAIEGRHREARKRGILHPEVDIVEVWREVVAERPAPDPRLLRQVAVTYECLVNPVWPSPGCREILNLCRSLDLKLGIVSNAQFYTPLMLEALLGGPPDSLGFDPDLLIWSWREGMAKPDIRLCRKALTRLENRYGIAPGETLCIGNDMRNDIAPAQAAGARGVLYAGDCRSYRPRTDDAALARIRPWAIVTSLDQLAGLLGPGD